MLQKILPKFHPLHPVRDPVLLHYFLQFVIFIVKTASFQSKNVGFIYLIFNELRWFYPWFSKNDFVHLPPEIINVL